MGLCLASEPFRALSYCNRPASQRGPKGRHRAGEVIIDSHLSWTFLYQGLRIYNLLYSAANFTTIANECEATMWRRTGMVVSFGTFSSMVRRLCCGSTSYIPQRTTFHSSLQDNNNQIIAIAPHLVTAFSTALPLDVKRHTTRPCERVKQQKGRARRRSC